MLVINVEIIYLYDFKNETDVLFPNIYFFLMAHNEFLNEDILPQYEGHELLQFIGASIMILIVNVLIIIDLSVTLIS